MLYRKKTKTQDLYKDNAICIGFNADNYPLNIEDYFFKLIIPHAPNSNYRNIGINLIDRYWRGLKKEHTGLRIISRQVS
jgi:hypothetical protein